MVAILIQNGGGDAQGSERGLEYDTLWYHRVISYSGTFVNQQWPFNPHERLIPGSPAKPIRIRMQVGDRDLYNPNIMRDDVHDWVIANHSKHSLCFKQLNG